MQVALALTLVCALRIILFVVSAEETNVRFYCMQPKSGSYAEVNATDAQDIAAKIDVHKPIGLLVHGWLDEFHSKLTVVGSTQSWMVQTLIDWTHFVDTNACAVDWHLLSQTDYIMAALTNTNIVAQKIVDFLGVVQRAGIPYDKVTIAGHSLGAHIASFAAQSVYKTTGHQHVDAIFGLDPAGPLFIGPTFLAKVLQPPHANYVQVMHTSAYTFGSSPIDDRRLYAADASIFTMNGGIVQPGCATEPVFGRILPPVCAHMRACHYFRLSLNPKHRFVGYELKLIGNNDNTSDLVGVWSERLAGRFRVTTTGKTPYCIGCV